MPTTTHQCFYFNNFQVPSSDFYKELETIIQNMKLPGVKTSRVIYLEGGILGTKRMYVRIVRGTIVYTVCFSNFGCGSFLSWRQGKQPALVFRFIPFMGALLERILYRKTFYRIDAEQMFKQIMNQTLQEIVKKIRDPRGIRGLTEFRERPAAKRPFSHRKTGDKVPVRMVKKSLYNI